MSNSSAVVCAAVAVIPGLMLGAVVGAGCAVVAGGGTGLIANACGASEEKSVAVGAGVGTVAYYAGMAYTTYAVVSGVYNAMSDD